MTLTSLLRALVERWILVVASLLLGCAVAGVVTLFLPRTYASSSVLYVAASDTSQNAQNAYQGTLLSQQRIRSYTELAVSDRVLQPVADELTPGRSADDLRDDLSVTAPLETTVMTVTAEARDPDRAAAIADAVATRFTDAVEELEEAPESGGPSPVTVSLVDAARPETDPVRPDVRINLVVGGVVGLVAGAGIALLLGALDTRIRTREQLLAATDLALLGTVPVVRSHKSESGALPDDPAFDESIRKIRTNLLFADLEKPPRVLAVTSAVPGEGRTTLTCALAAAFGPTSRVVIVEGDLRHPRMAARLDLDDGTGLTHVLSRRARIEDVLQVWDRHGVDVVVCGEIPPNPSELLSSQQMRDVVAQLAEMYDMVLIDTPPLEAVTDGTILARISDGAVLMCRQGSATASQVQGAEQSLRAVGAHLLGSVLTTRFPRRTPFLGSRRDGPIDEPGDTEAHWSVKPAARQEA